MSKSLTSLVSTVTANALPFNKSMDAVANKAAKMASTVNRTSVTVPLNTSPAVAKLNDVSARLAALQRTPPIPVKADTRAAMLQVKMLKGSITRLATVAPAMGLALPGASGVIGLAGMGPAGIALGVGAGLGILATSSARAAAQTARLAEQLNISNQSMTALQHAANLAGVEQGVLAGGLTAMRTSLAQAALGSVQQAQALHRLGLTALQLRQLAPDQQFAAIAERLRSITDPAQRAAAAVGIFGEQGRQLLPILNRGSSGLAEAAEEAERLGLAMSPDQIARLEAASESTVRMQASFQGLGNQIAITMIPVVDGLASSLANVTRNFQGFTSWIDDLLRRAGITTGGGTNAPGPAGVVWSAGLAGLFAGGATNPFAGQQASIMSGISQGLAAVLPPPPAPPEPPAPAPPPTPALAGGITAFVAGLNTELAHGSDAFGAAMTQFEFQLQSQVAGLQLEISDQLKPLLEQQSALAAQIAAGGMSAIPLLAQVNEQIAAIQDGFAGSSAELQEQFSTHRRIAERLQDQLRLVRQREQLESAALQTAQSLRSPMEIFMGRLHELNRLQSSGLLTAAQMNLATLQAFDTLRSSVGQVEVRAAPALEQFSAQAQAAINRFARQQENRVPVEEQIRQLMEQANAVQQAQLEEARLIREAILNLGLAEV